MVDPSPIWGLIAILALMCLTLSSVPIAASLGFVGLGFIALFSGSEVAAITAGVSAWSEVMSYSMTMVPLFVLMGELIGHANIGREAIESCQKWIGKIKGSLAIVSIFNSALFGCITGSTAATIATIGGVTIPEMKRHGYSIPLRIGAVASAGTLANLIPPSLIAIFYCVLTEASVGKVFMAGIIPGIILTVLFISVVFVWVRIIPGTIRYEAEEYNLKEKLVSLKILVPILTIFLVIIWGIYRGIFSPTEAAGIGVTLALVMVISMRRFTWTTAKKSLAATLRITGFLMIIIMGGMLFGQAIAITRFPEYLAGLITNLHLPNQLAMLAIVAVFGVLGCVLDTFGLMVLFIPLFLPSVVALGYDPVWFGTLSVVLIELGTITPPIAVNIYITQSIDNDCKTGDAVRGVFPFYLAVLVLILLLVFFPQIAMWLPNRMIGV